MAITAYSWRLKREALLLDEGEFAELDKLLTKVWHEAKDIRMKTGRPDIKKISETTPSARKALEIYEHISGIRLESVHSIYAVKACDYGAPCPACNIPMRTPRARFCMECGYSLPEGEKIGPLV